MCLTLYYSSSILRYSFFLFTHFLFRYITPYVLHKCELEVCHQLKYLLLNCTSNFSLFSIWNPLCLIQINKFFQRKCRLKHDQMSLCLRFLNFWISFHKQIFSACIFGKAIYNSHIYIWTFTFIWYYPCKTGQLKLNHCPIQPAKLFIYLSNETIMTT